MSQTFTVKEITIGPADSQRQIAELFGTKVPAISKHLKNIFASGELQEDMVISKMETTTRHCGHAIPVVPQRQWNPL